MLFAVINKHLHRYVYPFNNIIGGDYQSKIKLSLRNQENGKIKQKLIKYVLIKKPDGRLLLSGFVGPSRKIEKSTHLGRL